MTLTTYGKSSSAMTLAEILEKRTDVKKKVSANIHEYNQVLNEISKSNLSKKLKKAFLKNTLERFQTKMKRFDGEVQTFSLNVLSQNYRQHLNTI